MPKKKPGNIKENIREIKYQSRNLKETSKHYRILFENANDAILIMQGDRFVDCNKRAVKLFGYSKRQIIGQSPVKFSPAVQPDGIKSNKKAIAKIKKAYNGLPQRFEWQHINSHHKVFDTEVSLVKIKIAGEYFLHAIVRDITDRKKAEREILRNQLFVNRITEESPDIIFIYDVPKDRNIYNNKNIAELLGYNKNEYPVIDRKFFQKVIHPDDLIQFDKFYKEIDKWKKEYIFEFEYRMKDKNGSWRWFTGKEKEFERSENGKIISIIGTVREITEKKKYEEALKESEQRYKALSDMSVEGIAVHQQGILIDGNETLFRMVGHKREELIGKDVIPLVFPKDMIEEAREMSRTERDHPKEARYLKANGEEGVAEFRYRNLDYKGKKARFTSIYDITERIHFDAVLRESERRYKLLSDLAVEGIAIHSKGLLYDANETFLKMVGYQREELIGKDVIPIIFPKDQLENARRLNKVEREGPIEFKYLTKSGAVRVAEFRYKNMEYKGNQVRFTSVYDITERKESENAIQESEEKFRKLFQTSPNIIVISIIDNGLIIDINDEGAKMLGFKREEMIGKTSIELGVVSRKTREEMKKILKKHKEFSLVEKTLYKRNGEKMVCLLSGQLLIIQGETFLFQTIVDITPLKKSEERLMEYQQNLKKLTSELNLVEERERRRIAVNLHDHLTQSLAMTKIKLAEIEKKTPSNEIKQNLKEAGKYLDESIRNSRNITYELSPPVLYELGLSEAVEWLMKKIESTNDIKTVFESKLGEISISNDERILFYRSINELLNNSIKHSGCKTIWVYLWKEKDKILASVRDDGKGFIPEKVANKNPAKGGFGLFSIKERLEYLDGSIKISSIIGKGTNITLSLILKSVPLDEVVN
jgi:PAS domain S-box-containing protein